MAEYGITPEDHGYHARPAHTPRKSLSAPRYRDPTTGRTWSGRGRPPKWMAIKNPAALRSVGRPKPALS